MAITQAKQVLQTAPPKAVAAAAARGLRLREQHGRGGTAIGVARARDLSAQKSLSAQTIRRMHSYFARHSVDKNGKGWADAKAPSAGYIAWLLWGGDAGQRWAARLLQRLDAGASKKAGASTRAGGASKTAAKKQTSKTRGATSLVTKKTPARKAATKKSATKKAATKKAATKKSATKKSATKKSAANKPARKSGAKKVSARKTAVKKVASRGAPGTKRASTTTARTTARKTSAQRGTASKSATSAKAVKKATARKSAPWKTPNPKSASRSTSLSPAQKSQARKRAKAAGRPYPNLVDNMAVASKRTTKRAGTSGAAKKTATKK
ncbi:DNA-binding protein [Xanthomonas cannabis]|uniref:DNA-binding protein n=1 Tax=Xanthomonas cannabis TaxID=1885674 RepID=UPI000B26037A|nr:DNA-binding protein [Xanthomonas cannabis]